MVVYTYLLYSLQIITGGLVNLLFGCHKKSDTNKTDMIVIRIHGDQTEKLNHHEDKAINYALFHAAGIGAPLYSTFKNGIAYVYITGECLNEESVRIPEISK